MWPFLTLLLACGLGGDDLPPVTDDAAQSTSASVRQCLEGAVQLRQADQSAPANKAVLACYATHFEPMEAALRSHNRKATLSLEYEFGRVAAAMAQPGTGQPAIGMASRLSDRVERVLASLPVVRTQADTGGT